MRNILLLQLALIANITAYAQIKYPQTRKVNQVDTVFGHILNDPYRWLENLKSEEVLTWFKAQQHLTDSTLSKLNGVDSFISQINDFNSHNVWWRAPITKVGSRYYYTKRSRSQLNASYYFRNENDTMEHLLFDTWQIHEGMRYNLAALKISPDNRYLAVALDANGEEYSFVKFYDTKSNRWLADSIPPCYANSINWDAASEGVIYGMNTSDDRFNPANLNKEVIKYHLLNTSHDKDKIILDSVTRNSIERKISDSYYADIFTRNSKTRVYSQPNQGFEFEFGNTYYTNSTALNKLPSKWNILYRQQDSVYDFIETPSGYYFISAKGHGYNSLRKTSYNKPDFSSAVTLLPEDRDWQLENIRETKSYILAVYSKWGFINKVVCVAKKDDKVVRVQSFDKYDRFSVATLGNETDECFLSQYPVNRPRASYLMNVKIDSVFLDSFWIVKNQSLIEGWENIVCEVIEVPSYDGTKVPLAIMRDKNVKLDGNNICFINGYGAYGIAAKNNAYNMFNPAYSLLIQRGVILAHAYVRGGGEKGEAWHRAAMKGNKPNTWKDFIACAEFLVKNKYTQPSKLACTGASAGGILVGRAITERPDLFAAAHIQSGALNTSRLGATANGVNNYAEFGDPSIPEEFNGLVEMDPTLHVEMGVKYPAVYITTGLNDPRVAAWIPAKFAATMQAASVSGKPVLLHTNFAGGHFGDANAESVISLLRKQLMSEFFLLWQCGHKDFQMK
jgi:prolyl oligopeptidase